MEKLYQTKPTKQFNMRLNNVHHGSDDSHSNIFTKRWIKKNNKWTTIIMDNWRSVNGSTAELEINHVEDG